MSPIKDNGVLVGYSAVLYLYCNECGRIIEWEVPMRSLSELFGMTL